MSRRRSLYGRLIGPVTLAGLAATAGHAQPRPTPRPIPRPLPGPRPLPVPAPEYCQNLTFPAGCWTYEGTAFVKVVPGLNPRNRAELSSVNNRGSGNVTSDPILLDQPETQRKRHRCGHRPDCQGPARPKYRPRRAQPLAQCDQPRQQPKSADRQQRQG